MAQPHNGQKRTSGVPRITRAGTWLHWLGMLAMVVGLFAPLATVDATATVMTPEQSLMKAAQQPFDRDTADFQRVVLVGNFQHQLGCGDWDTNCDQSRLVNINGFWTGVFGIPPGTWDWELVAIDRFGTQYAVDDGQVSVADGQSGIYSEFDSASRSSNVWAVTQVAYANGSFGDVALAQDGDGYVATALNIANDGWVDMQVTVGGESLTTGADFRQGVSRVTFDSSGNITNVEHRGFAEITVERVDADGNPLGNSCFVLEGSSQSRACDTDGSQDGNANGSTVLRFPAGFQPGGYTLRETRAADGAEQLSDQQIDVQPGQATIQARSEGEPTPETGDLVVLRQDANGAPVGGACFEIINANGEVVAGACDEDGDVADDGRIGLLGVPAGDYTLSETRTPDGYEPATDVLVSVFPNQVTEQGVFSNAVPVDDPEPIETEEPTEEATEEATEEPTEEATEEATEEPTEEATEEPTEEVTQAPAVGRIIVYRQDDAGNPVGGSCFEVIDNNGQIVGDACDEDGIAADDGTTGIENIPTGTYNLVESRVPEGHEQAQDTQVTVNEGDNIYDVFAPAIPVTEEPTEEATEEATEEPTEEATEEATEEPTEEATEVPTEPVVVGRIVVYREDGQGNRVGGSCFEARDANGNVVGANCDEDGIAPNDGSIGVVDMPAGDFTLVETRIPDGYEQVPDTQVTVVQGDAIYTVSAPALPEVDEPTEEATEEPTEEATEEPTEEATEEPTEVAPPTDEGAALSVTYDVDDSQPLACIELDTTGAIGMMELPYACDNGANDENPEAGTIEMQSLDAGDFVVVPFEGPESVVQADPQPVTLVEGETAAVTFESEEPAVTSFVVQTSDGTNLIAGACYILDEQGDVLCDNDGAGVTFNDVLPGEHDVRMTDAPDGYSVSDSDTQLVDVAEDGSTVATFQVVLNTTSLVIRTTDGSATVGGACYQIDDDEPVCDDGSGVLTVSGITPGQHTVSMASAPAGFENAPEQTVEVAADSSSEVTFAVERSTTSFVINTTDGTNPVGGACYSLPFAGPFCDDGTGSLTVTDVPPLDVEVQMSSAPDGYEAANPQTVSIAADGSTVVTFEVNRITVDIVVNTVDESTGESLGGACYRLDDGDVQCDEDASGQVVFEGEVPGEKTLSMDTAPAGFEPAEDQIIAADVSNIEVGLQQTNGNIVVTITDGTNPLAGACVQLGSEEPVCDGADGDGSITFADLAADSEQTVTITSAPDGYDLPEEGARSQTVTVLADEDNPVQFVLSETPPATGSIVVTVTDGTNPLPGACVQLGSEEPVCDGVDGDGTITFADLAADSEQTVTITSAPEGYDLPEEGARSQTATVVSDTDTPVEFVLSETPPATGTLDVTVLFSDETSAANVCVIVTQVSGGDATATECDTDGDGVVNFAKLPEGSYSVTLDESQYDGPAIETVVPVTGTVEAGAANTATLYLTLLPTTGTLEVSVLSSGSPVAGACLTVGGNTICDGGAGDTDGTANGVVVVAGLDPTENLVVAMSTVPSGYQQPADQTASISAGDTTSLEFNLVAEVLPGSVTVQTVDGDGEPLTNACYRLVQGSTVFGPRCDVDPADGQIVFEDVPAGTYRLEQTRTPSNQFQTAPSQNVTVNAGEDTTVEITMDLRPGQLRITTLDRDDQSIVLQGACFMLVSDSELGPFCDANDGNSDGIVRFFNVPAGQYELRQTVATAGYETAPNRNVTINAGGNTQITVLNSRVQPPAESGTLVVIPLAPNGEPVPGGCYQVFNGDTPVTNRICDNADDQPARITIENLPVGELTLRETLAPSPDWQIAADITVTIRNGETTTVEVPHQYKRGHVVIQAVNSVGLPLQGACFTLTDAGDMEICTDSTGQATVSGLEPGTRQLTQTKAPFGFKLNETPREVIVRPGQTTTVRVVFENEPPPNTGTVQIQKFFCPAGEEGERTRFLGGAQGNQELKQTAGCEPGVARFTLVAEDGSTESNAEFSTNEEGRAQLTAVEGIYLLTETDPDLPGNSSARLRVGTGQMTTVIVINYVAPPAPAPVTINVEGYTCAPGFSGSSFADFQASCMAQSQLTNQITVRAEAGNRYKRVTGDGGVVGKTSFVELPAGNYTIWSERPHSIPVTYLFCGADVNAPTLKAVNGSVSISLESGSTILCRVFQVPPLFDAEHGAIQVHKFNCPINERQRGYDYQNECSRPTEPIAFEIVMLAKTDGTTPEPVRVSTNGDGIVQFPMLVPGTYKLTEVEGEWCFAQSNSVDAEGNVVVHKNKLSEVWVYNCVGTKSPPNTGSGDAAGLTGGDGGIAPMQVLPNLLWPTVMLAGWIVWRDRRQA